MIYEKRSKQGLVNPLIMVMKAKVDLELYGHKLCQLVPLLNVNFYHMSIGEKQMI